MRTVLRATVRPPVAVLAGAVITILAALAFPLAPVHQPVVTFGWPQAPGQTAVALPLMPYQPVALDASVSCASLAATPPGASTLATTPPGTAPAPVGGLTVRPDGGRVSVTSNGQALATAALPGGPCTLTVSSRPERTEVRLDGQLVGARDGDVRPVVAGILTGAPTTDGLGLALRTDTRFQTTPGALKIALGVVVLLGLATMLIGAVRLDGRSRTRCRWPRPRPVDGVVGLGLLGWALLGPATVDDGYITGILLSRGENGFIGNVFRWLNAPEAPFSWFYEVTRTWAEIAPGGSPSVLWLRVPALVLGVAIWVLLRRHALPRLGAALRRPGTTWAAAAMFAAWWVPFGDSMRPEPWVALGVLAVWVAAERAVATRALLPLLVAALLAGLTVALTPGALLGLAPLLVVWPALARAGLGVAEGWRRLVAVAAALAVAVLPMAADQSLAGLREATRVRQVIGGGAPWWNEITRYTTLLTPGDVQGGLAARLPVLLTLLALPALAWSLLVLRPRIGVAPGPAQRLLAVVALAPALLVVSPTKWTLHFGELIGVGAALLTLFVVLWSPRLVAALDRLRGPVLVTVLAAAGLAAALVLAGRNLWPFVGAWGVAWTDSSPQIGSHLLGTAVLGATILVAGALAALVCARGPLPRSAARLLAPGALVLVLVVGAVTVVGASFVKATVDRAGTFTYGSDSLAALRGRPCGLADDLAVEPDPRAGLLAPVDANASLDGFVPGAPVTIGGAELPGWTAPARPAADGPSTLVSGWYRLPDDARAGRVPVVVAASGSLAGGSVSLEFAATPATVLGVVTPTGPTEALAPHDLRAIAPADATLVRVRATSTARDTADALASSPTGVAPEVPLTVSAPRVPRTVPFDDVVPPGSTALVDWPVAFVFGCLRPPAISGGTAAIPPWRVTPPGLSDAGEIAVAARTGGPFLTPRLLVDEVRVPVYLDGDPTRDAVGLARWVPRQPLGSLTPQVGDATVSGWAQTGRATVPGVDTP